MTTGYSAAFDELDRSRRVGWARYYEERALLIWAWIFVGAARRDLLDGRWPQADALLVAAMLRLSDHGMAHVGVGGACESDRLAALREVADTRLFGQFDPPRRLSGNGWPTVHGKCM